LQVKNVKYLIANLQPETFYMQLSSRKLQSSTFFYFNMAAKSFIVVTMPRIDWGRNCLTLDTKPLVYRILFSLVVAILLLPVIYGRCRVFKADWIVSGKETVGAYSQALKFNPSDPMLWWYRGRLRHYSVDSTDIQGAISDYNRALDLNPRLGQAQVDLADCYQRAGKDDEAEAALEKAFKIRPYSPLIRWQAGNFFLHRGKLDKMYECFKRASELDGSNLGIAMDRAWKADPDHRQILQKLIPDDIQSNLSYLAFLVGKDELDLARPVWQRCIQDELPDDFQFKVSVANSYIDRLLAKNRISEAVQIWNAALAKAGFTPPDAKPAEERGQGNPKKQANLVWNGSFENEIAHGGFGWRYPDEAPNMQFHIDLNNRVEGLKSLCVQFGGANLSFSHLRQIVPVFEPGMYELNYYLRTEGLTTDQMPYLSIQGYPDASCAEARSNPFPATSAWSQVSLPFTVKQGCKAIDLILRRDPSSKFDNRLKGSLWLDSVGIYRAPNPGGKP
jgi:tetratricopeptide (TPR) repeat protein